MKLILPLLALLGLSSAQITANQLDALNAPNYCNASTVSCHWSGAVDACCSPKYGLVVLALQWSPGWGPADEFTIHGKHLSYSTDEFCFTQHVLHMHRFMARYMVSLIHPSC